MSNHPIVKYRADIDGLRALAVLLVVGYHAFPSKIKSGFIGVDVFFVISGFLISTIIFEKLSHNDFSFIEFYSRRIKRIFPSLITVLLGCFLFSWLGLLADEFKILGKHIAGGAGFISNLILWQESGYFDSSADTKPLLHLWSLGIEEQFYFIWPLLLWASWKKKSNLLIVTLSIITISFLLNIIIINKDITATFYSPLTRFWELMTGALLSYFKVYKEELLTHWSHKKKTIISSLGFFILFLALVFISSNSEFPGWWALLPTVGTSLIIAAGDKAWINQKILSSKPLVWIGLISFPLYLWHWPILTFLKIVVTEFPTRQQRLIAVALSFVFAWITYAAIEKPFRFSKSKFSVYALITGMLCIGTAGYLTYLKNGLPQRFANQLKVINEGDIGHDIFHQYPYGKFVLCTPDDLLKDALKYGEYIRCFQTKAGPIDTVIIGDSHAEHLFIGLALAFPNKNIAYYTKGSIPFYSNSEYSKIYDSVISNPRITTIIISAYWFVRWGEIPSGSSLEQELQKTVTELRNKKIYITDDTPNFSFSPKHCKYAGNSIRSFKCSEKTSFYNSQHSTFYPSIEAIFQKNPHVTILKTSRYFCNTEDCFMAQNGKLFFRDNGHLNVNGSIYLGNKIKADYKIK
ncbi:MAG: acyltransferase [Xanthomonadaceae bacterium]|nr:acyltransferase [Xanthomonadaceae bacterium]